MIRPIAHAAPLSSLSAPALPGEIGVSRLDNGLTVCALRNRQAPLITTALWYRAGARDESAETSGVAHFLEHMMFKGSRRYAPGEIDRRTQALGGSNNAFTSHDATAYYFNFERDSWLESLAIEADRMTALTLDPDEVASERQVILEELSMYEDEPWDALEQAVQRALFYPHPYGRPILGSRETLAATGRDQLADFHRRYYRPDNAVLVVAGDLPDDAGERVAEHFADLPAGASPRPSLGAPPELDGWRRVERRRGDVARLCLQMRAPQAGDPSYPALRLLLAVLTSGRASRLHRALVEESKQCLWVGGQLAESPLTGWSSITLEVLPGVEPGRVEEAVLAALAEIARRPPGDDELERARRLLRADWVFAHERVHQQALTAGFALGLFDLAHPRRLLERALGAGRDELAAAALHLDPRRGGVIGWSLPASDEA